MTHAASLTRKRNAEEPLTSPPPNKRVELNPPLQINDLPLEILDLIFKFLPATALGQTAQVCHWWKTLSTQDHYWRHLCFKAGCLEKKEGQTWRDIACEQAKFNSYFAKGTLLSREPKVASSRSKFFNASLFEGQTRDIFFCANKDFMVTRRVSYEDDTTTLVFERPDERKETFSLKIDGNITTMALQKNILATFGQFRFSDGEKKLGLRLINLNDKNLETNNRFYPYTGEPHFQDAICDTGYSSVWKGYTFYIMLDSFETDIINAWDFFEGPLNQEKTG